MACCTERSCFVATGDRGCFDRELTDSFAALFCFHCRFLMATPRGTKDSIRPTTTVRNLIWDTTRLVEWSCRVETDVPFCGRFVCRCADTHKVYRAAVRSFVEENIAPFVFEWWVHNHSDTPAGSLAGAGALPSTRPSSSMADSVRRIVANERGLSLICSYSLCMSR